MNKELQHAYHELQQSGALSLPSQEEVDKANAISFWTGTSSDGTLWQLVKHGEGSYTVICGSESKPHSLLDK